MGANSSYSFLPPVGSVIDFAGPTAPSRWALCFGQELSRTTYAALFAEIGTTWGVGNGSTTFNLPDLRGRVTAGVDNMGGDAANRLNQDTPDGCLGILGQAGGQQSHVLTTTELAAHTHALQANVTTWSGTGGSVAIQGTTDSADGALNTTTDSVGGDATHNNVQPTAVMNKIIYTGV